MVTQLPLPFPPGYIEIKLSKAGKKYVGKVALVSSEDADLDNANWYARHAVGDTFYASRWKVEQGKTKGIHMHRVILERMIGKPLGANEMPDHINGNGLDNRRENLRLATGSQNQANRRLSKNSTSGYKGVSWYKRTQSWKVEIRINRKKHHLGYFTTKEAAYEAYCKKAKELFGEYTNAA